MSCIGLIVYQDLLFGRLREIDFPDNSSAYLLRWGYEMRVNACLEPSPIVSENSENPRRMLAVRNDWLLVRELDPTIFDGSPRDSFVWP